MVRDPLRADEYVFEQGELPDWLPGPLKRVGYDLIYDEAHAAELGLVGLPLGIALGMGATTLPLSITATLVAFAFGLKRAPNEWPIAGRVVRKEPWYFTTVLFALMTLAAPPTMILA